MKTVLFLSILLSFSACSPKPRNISPLEAYGMLQNDFGILIDTRENVTEIAQRAQWIPAKQFLSKDPKTTELLSNIPNNKMIILYGKNGEKVAKFLAKMGHKCGHFSSLQLWKDSGLPTTYPATHKK